MYETLNTVCHLFRISVDLSTPGLLVGTLCILSPSHVHNNICAFLPGHPCLLVWTQGPFCASPTLNKLYVEYK